MQPSWHITLFAFSALTLLIGRQTEHPVKIEWWGTGNLAWLSAWSEVQMICIWCSWCHCHRLLLH